MQAYVQLVAHAAMRCEIAPDPAGHDGRPMTLTQAIEYALRVREDA